MSCVQGTQSSDHESSKSTVQNVTERGISKENKKEKYQCVNVNAKKANARVLILSD